MLYNYQQQLEEAREREKEKKAEARETIKKYNTGKNKGQAAETIRSAKELAKAITPWGLFSLLRYGSLFSDWMYGLALFAAILKDTVDLTIIGSIPGIGTVITFLASIWIAFMMILGSFGNSHGRRQQKIIRSWLTLLSGTTVELLFGINFLPLETLTVLIVYLMMLSDRKAAKEEKRQSSYAQESYA